MTVVVLGLVAGIGCIGAVRGVRSTVPSLESIVRSGGRPFRTSVPKGGPPGLVARVGQAGLGTDLSARLRTGPRWESMQCALAITGQTPEQVVGRSIVGLGLGLVLPPALWAAAAACGVSAPLLAPVILTVVLVPAAGCLPVATLLSEASRRRHHVRTVVASYVDLVVLSLAGGVGIEGSLVAAAEISPDWAARRIARSLSLARDTGEPAWEALQALGAELGVTELMELAASLQLAGTEGARVRQSLAAMAASLRRHEQAEAESAANATTERLFLPGALLLVGFLLFVGYPAMSRILIGF